MRTKLFANTKRPRKIQSRSFFTFAVSLALPLCFIACPGEEKRSAPAVRAADSAPISTTEASAAASPPNLTIDADSAFKHVEKQVGFGPRPAGSAQLAKTREYLLSELRSYGLSPTTDQFTTSTPVGEKQMVNIVAELPGQSPEIIIISSHYDTKLFDKFKFVGANDGASSTAVLLELARVLAANKEKPKVTYRFVFFDGEEAFCEHWEQCGKPDSPDNTYGSRHYAKQLVDRNEASRVRAMILLDMIGYKKLEIGRDDDMSTKWLVDSIWDTARELGYSQQFQNRTEGVGGDDHEPFLRAGIESVDLIQLGSYPYWHTPDDTLDKISSQSLKIVGDVVLASLPKIESHRK
jgi:glutaminyl-peptide cyclotransferase